jgi:hypothetical protein
VLASPRVELVLFLTPLFGFPQLFLRVAQSHVQSFLCLALLLFAALTPISVLVFSLGLALLFFEVPPLCCAHFSGLPLHRSGAFPVYSSILAPTQTPKHQHYHIYGEPRCKPKGRQEREPQATDVDENESQHDDLGAHASQRASE